MGSLTIIQVGITLKCLHSNVMAEKNGSSSMYWHASSPNAQLTESKVIALSRVTHLLSDMSMTACKPYQIKSAAQICWGLINTESYLRQITVFINTNLLKMMWKLMKVCVRVTSFASWHFVFGLVCRILAGSFSRLHLFISKLFLTVGLETGLYPLPSVKMNCINNSAA